MPDTQELSAPVPPPEDPPPSGHKRPLLVAASVAAIIAVAALLVTVTSGDGERTGSTTETAPPPSTRTDEEDRDASDPLRPQGRATLDPSVRSDTEAAVRGNWPLVTHDEFDGTSLDESLWDTYTGETTGGVGRHDPKNLSVSDGTLKLTSHDYSSAGMAWAQGQQYGRWEVRARAQRGTGYGAVILLWPDAEDWPEGGEINFMEIPNGERNECHFVLHYGEDNDQVGTTTAGDFTEWHTYATEWTPDHVAGFIDGQEIFRSSDPQSIPPRPMHLAIQQDIGPYGNDWIPPLDATTPAQVQLEVDWVRIYGA